MVKIKDFTLASKNLGGGTRAPPPCPTELQPMTIDYNYYKYNGLLASTEGPIPIGHFRLVEGPTLGP